ncbi:MAG: hypothetical protein ABIS67_09940 [Candidatus Eisenbacteria bacterium]
MPRSVRATTTLVAVAGLLVLTGCISRKFAPATQSGALRIASLTADPDTIFINQQSLITAQIDNPSGSGLTYSWTASRGSVVGDGPSARYFGSYCCAGTDWVVLLVRNDDDERDTKLLVMTVFQTEQ